MMKKLKTISAAIFILMSGLTFGADSMMLIGPTQPKKLRDLKYESVDVAGMRVNGVSEDKIAREITKADSNNKRLFEETWIQQPDIEKCSIPNGVYWMKDANLAGSRYTLSVSINNGNVSAMFRDTDGYFDLNVTSKRPKKKFPHDHTTGGKRPWSFAGCQYDTIDITFGDGKSFTVREDERYAGQIHLTYSPINNSFSTEREDDIVKLELVTPDYWYFIQRPDGNPAYNNNTELTATEDVTLFLKPKYYDLSY